MTTDPRNSKIVNDSDLKKTTGGFVKNEVRINLPVPNPQAELPVQQSDSSLSAMAAGAAKVVGFKELQSQQVDANQDKPEPWKDGGPQQIG